METFYIGSEMGRGRNTGKELFLLFGSRLHAFSPDFACSTTTHPTNQRITEFPLPQKEVWGIKISVTYE